MTNAYFRISKPYFKALVFVYFISTMALPKSVTAHMDATTRIRTHSTAIPQHTPTSLGKLLEEDVKNNPGTSGFHILATGSESFKYRLALIQSAEKTIDLQYYAMHDDFSGNLIQEALIQAAERGVRVRFLIDHISMNEVGKDLAVLDGLNNIEIRVFNPTSSTEKSYISQLIGWITDFGKVFKRMHNKALIADNQLAIIGGRNLGNEYFEVDKESDFRDIDVLSAGPITSKISESFDHYWNAEHSIPIRAIRKPFQTRKEVGKLRVNLKDNWQQTLATEDGRKLLKPNLENLLHNEQRLIWAKAELRVDDPEKIEMDADQAVSKPLNQLKQMATNAKEEFIIVSSYFVAQEEGVAWIKSLVDRGIKVKILTNSLASTDVVAVHAGYEDDRKPLLKSGVELYEFKPIGNKKPKQRLIGSKAPATASLHTKMFIVDRSSVLIGSFNLDPRSESLNTEIALVIHHPKIATQFSNIFEEAISMNTSYTLSLKGNENVQWTTDEKGKKVIYHHNPKAIMRSIQIFFMGLLPLEDQL